MDLLYLDMKNIHMYEDFLRSTSQSNTFRYYASRSLQCITNHIYTILGFLKCEPIAYGHIDLEGKYWLGIYVKEEYRGKGFGKQIMQNLLSFAQGNQNIQTLHLSVDKGNEKAIQMYLKFGFTVESEKEAILFMKKSIHQTPFLHLPVSFGEYFDKLSILAIKEEKIQDARKADVQKELLLLQQFVNPLLNHSTLYWYSLLKKVNLSIWEKQDHFRESSCIEEKNKLCFEIIEENDARFRIKSKLNSLLQSGIVEQKGYIAKKAFLLTHVGLGDIICNIGAIRYLSTLYDEVKVVVRRQDYKNIQLLLSDDKCITFYILESNDTKELSLKQDAPLHVWTNATSGYTCYLSGFYSETNTTNIYLPFNFYLDYKINTEIYWSYFHVPTLPQSIELEQKLKDRQYIFIHNYCSSGKTFSVEFIESKFNISRNSILFINPNENVYESHHEFYSLANEFLQKPLAFYKGTIENAETIVCCDSSFFCLSMNLQLKAKQCFYFARDTRRYEHIWTQFKPPSELGKKQFICLN